MCIRDRRNADRLSEYDREDMKLVREDYGTKVLYYIDCTAKDKQNTSITSAVEAVRTGTFDGIALGLSLIHILLILIRKT